MRGYRLNRRQGVLDPMVQLIRQQGLKGFGAPALGDVPNNSR
jgi:hypothetical protein